MNTSLALALPPLRKIFFRRFLIMTGIFGCVGIFLIGAVFLASGITPKAIHLNYDSIAAANEMRGALASLRHPQEGPQVKPEVWILQFEKALTFEEGNITEPGEGRIAASLRKNWTLVKMDVAQIRTDE